MLDPAGHFILIKNNDQKEERIGCISAINYGQFAFIGLFIVIPTERSQGHGKTLWQHAMKYIENIACQGLYAVPKQVSRYKSYGFTEHGLNRCFKQTTPKLLSSQSPQITKFNEDNNILPSVAQYDEQIFPASRLKVLTAMLLQDRTYGLVYVDKEHKKVQGYCIIRPLYKGFRIGPLYANTAEVAKALMHEAICVVGENQEIMLNSTLENNDIHMFAEYFKLSMVEDADLTAMFKGDEPVTLHENKNKRFAELSLEIG